MARKPTGQPTGRPEAEIDWELFEKLCGLLCTQSEIASMLCVHIDTLRDRVLAEYGEEYSSIYKRYSESGKCSLRRNQVVLSKKNAAMAIWLGKQWLDQKDKSPNTEALELNLTTLLKMMLEGKITQGANVDNLSKVAPQQLI